MPEAFALYVHIPWCRRVCPYCDFNVYALGRPPQATFVATLAAELACWMDEPAWRERPVKSVFLGGGTPSLFSAESLGTLLLAVESTCGLAAEAEITLEANPGTVTREQLGALRDVGVNRLSFGVQSFQPALLRTLGRDHSPDDSHQAVVAARAAGFTNVSIDLIFGVPGQTPAMWAEDLDAALALQPNHLSAYALTYEPGTPFHAWRQSGRLTPVPEDDELAMMDRLAECTAAAGFERYEISSWARGGAASRHNQAYWDGSDYLGLGPGAHSYCHAPTPGVRFVNERLPDPYRAIVAQGRTAVSGVEQLTIAQARADFVIAGLRRIVGVDGAAFSARFDATLEQAFPQIVRLIGDGLLEWAGSRLRLSAQGLLFADTVSAALI
jgi:oxygen-independent coproporphyrinogen III oxidase